MPHAGIPGHGVGVAYYWSTSRPRSRPVIAPGNVHHSLQNLFWENLTRHTYIQPNDVEPWQTQAILSRLGLVLNRVRSAELGHASPIVRVDIDRRLFACPVELSLFSICGVCFPAEASRDDWIVITVV